MLGLEFAPNGRWHEDLVLELDERVWTCDSYYFLIDDSIDGPEDQAKVERGLVRLLDQWLMALRSAAPVDLIYLPYDFSDQYIGSLECRLQLEEASITRGCSLTPACSVRPSNISGFSKKVRDFQKDGPAVLITRNALCAFVHESVQSIIARQRE